MKRFMIPRVAHCDGGALTEGMTMQLPGLHGPHCEEDGVCCECTQCHGPQEGKR